MNEEAFNQYYGHADGAIYTYFCPGRINLIGEHIDYNGGYVFPAALTLGITAMVRKRHDQLLKLRSLNAHPDATIDLNTPIVYKPEDGWANYPKGVIRALLEEGYKLPGCEVLYNSNLPDGAGLSSSAALEVVTAYMLAELSGVQEPDKARMARLSQQVENEFIQVNCGIMDQFAVALGKQDHALMLNCDTLAYEYIPLVLKDHTLVIMNSNKKRALSESKYNERREACDQALAQLHRHADIHCLCAASEAQVEIGIHDPVLKKRALHAVTEQKRVLEAGEKLQEGDLAAFGALMNASHASLRDQYEVTGKELDALTEAARQQEGCLGARMTGAGFGGCAIALVANQVLDSFTKQVGKSYYAETGLQAGFYFTKPGEGVHRIVKAEAV